MNCIFKIAYYSVSILLQHNLMFYETLLRILCVPFLEIDGATPPEHPVAHIYAFYLLIFDLYILACYPNSSHYVLNLNGVLLISTYN